MDIPTIVTLLTAVFTLVGTVLYVARGCIKLVADWRRLREPSR